MLTTDGTTALMYAIINAHFDTAAVLIEKGADPNVADSTGTTALYSAVDMHTMGPMLSRPFHSVPSRSGQTGYLTKQGG